MVCELVAEGGRTPGIVLDLSANGVFVQTSATLPPGSRVDLELQLPGSKEPIRIHGRVARRRAVPARLRSVVQGGIGVAIDNAPEAFFRFIAELQKSDVQASELQNSEAQPQAPAEEPTASPRPQSNLARKALLERLRRLRVDHG